MRPAFKPIIKDYNKLFWIERQETSTDFDYPWHYHPEYELTLVLSRSGIRYVGNNIEHFFDNDLVLLGSKLPHTWIDTGEDKEKNYTRAFVIFLSEEFINWLDSGHFANISGLFQRSNHGILFNKKLTQEVKSQLPKLLDSDPFEQCIILLQLFKKLAAAEEYRLLSTHVFHGTFDQSRSDRINTVYNFVSQNYGARIYLSDVAQTVSMSEENFSRFFSKTMKKSFFTFLNEYRISIASRLLIETDKQITEICYLAGFDSIPFFYKQFKKFMECQPRAFRLKYQKASH